MNLELYKEIVSTLSPEVTLRHDVDVSIEAAFEIAKIDKELGRKSCFYLRFFHGVYQIDNATISTFIDLGHKVGAHVSINDITPDEGICGALRKIQSAYFNNWHLLGNNLHGFTFHINSPESLKYDKPEYCFYKNHNLCPNGYISDSRGVFPIIPQDFKGVLNLHPEWWVYPGNSPKEKLEYYFNQQKEKCLKEILPDLHS